MTATSTRLDRQADRIEGNAAHAEALLRAFDNDPTGWEMTGTGEQDGSAPGSAPCACGHRPINFLFFWTHPDKPNRTVITGSVCVETVPGLDPASIARIRAHVEQLREKANDVKRRARDAAKSVEVRAMVEQIMTMAEAKYGEGYRRYANPYFYTESGRWSWADREEADRYCYFWKACAHAQKLTTPGRQLASLRTAKEVIEARCR